MGKLPRHLAQDFKGSFDVDNMSFRWGGHLTPTIDKLREEREHMKLRPMINSRAKILSNEIYKITKKTEHAEGVKFKVKASNHGQNVLKSKNSDSNSKQNTSISKQTGLNSKHDVSIGKQNVSISRRKRDLNSGKQNLLTRYNVSTGKQNVSNVKQNVSNVKQNPSIIRRKRVLLTNTLTWDTGIGSVTEYLTKIEDLVKSVAKVSKINHTRNIYLSGVGYANDIFAWKFAVRNGKYRNGYLERALNKIVLDKMTEAGIEVLDIYNMLYSVNDKYVNRMHYLMVIPMNQEIRGEFGSTVADTIIFKLCGK